MLTNHTRITHLFFQCFHDEIENLPDVMVEKISLLPDLLKVSRSSNTCASYSNGFKRWNSWVLSNGFNSKEALPAKPFHVALYLASLVQTANSPSPVINAFYSIKWYHELFGFLSPTDNNLVKNILEAAKRKLAKPIVKDALPFAVTYFVAYINNILM